VISSSVLGHHCRLEESAVVVNSHLWDGVHVEKGAQINQAVLGEGVVVRQGAVVSRGCVIGAGAVIGRGCVLPEFTRVTLKAETGSNDFDDNDWGSEDEEDVDRGDAVKPKSTMESDSQEVVSDPTVVGPDGKGSAWIPPSDDDHDDLDEDDDDDVSTRASEGIFATDEVRNAQTLGYDRSSYYRQLEVWQVEESDELSDEDEDLDPMENSDLDVYDTGAVTFDDPDVVSPAAAGVEGRQRGVDVIKELKQICLEYEGTAPIENLAIELNAFKFSQNATYSDCTMAATLAILDMMTIGKSTTDGKLVADFKAMLDRWAPLLRRFSIGVDEEKAIVLGLEKAATADNETGEVLSTGRSFRFLLQTLHDEEIVSEDAILSWAEDRRAIVDVDSPVAKVFALQPVQDFLEWLAESEDEESDEEDEGDE
jgi:translation initiation factor eIF-2B subunit epsilon